MIPADDDTARIGVPTVAIDGGGRVSPNESRPVDALRSVVGRLLDDRPCFVAFSGGCDSSLVLSVATAACRSTGHADPVPVTYRFPRAAGTQERDYQERVVRHLDLRDWIVIDLDDDGDVLGGPATKALRKFGLAWPPAVFAQVVALQQLDEGLLLTGEGGDELLGWRRVSPIARVAQRARHGRAPTRAQSRVALDAFAPRSVRETLLAQHLEREYGAEWLEPVVRHDLIRRVARLDAAEPLGARPYFEYALGRPSMQIGHHNVRTIHARFGLQWEAPLYDRGFLGSLSTLRWPDYRGRTEMLRKHFSDLLPAEIVERQTKARFNRAYMGRATRAFARRWNGSGLPEGVNAGWLKHHWCTADDIHTGTATLLHHAWLATEGAPNATTVADRESP